MQEYIDRGHAQKVPKEEQNRDDGKVWYLPHHPVIHQVKPEKTRIIFDCAAKFNGQSLNDYFYRFLGWENHDFKETPTEYRTVKHVFDATSSQVSPTFV